MLAFLRKHGLAVFADPIADHAVVAEPCLLPNPSIADDNIPDKIPFRIHLDADCLRDFGRGGSVAATHFGPASLASDKIQNEDFALAGVLDGSEGPLSFGIVADGVTSKTFWPARASRLAAFAAYETLKKLAAANWQPSEGDASGVDRLVNDLCNAVDRRFRDDREILMKFEAVPARWDRQLYRQHGEKLAFWYQTTLLVVVIGSRGGWLVYCGDGGIVRFLTDSTGIVDSKIALESPETVELSSAVSIGISPLNFTRAFVRAAPPNQSLHVVMASDGVDRSLKNKRDAGTETGYAMLDLGSQTAAQASIEQIVGWPEADRDNMSLVRVCFPPDASWRPAGTKPQEGSKIIDPDGSPKTVDDSPPIAPAHAGSVWYSPRALVIAVAVLVAIWIGAGSALLLVAAGPGQPLLSWLQARLAGQVSTAIPISVPSTVEPAPKDADPSASKSASPEQIPETPRAPAAEADAAKVPLAQPGEAAEEKP